MQAAAQHDGIPGNRQIPHSNRRPILCISNRYTELLKFRVTYTKQTTGVLSNRYKMALSRNPFRALKCAIPSATIASTKNIFAGQKEFTNATSKEVTAQ